MWRYRYEIWGDKDNINFFQLSKEFGWNVRACRLQLSAISHFGYLNDETTGKQILDAIDRCSEIECNRSKVFE